MREAVAPIVSVIIPAYNESLTIGKVVSSAIASLNMLGYPYEVIVIDDDSFDLTGEVAKDAGATVIKNQRSFGKGFSVRTGFAAASGEIIVTMDADGENDPDDIGKLISILKEADIVSGSRFLIKPKNYSLFTQLGNFLFGFVIEFLFRKRITDSQTGFRAIKKTPLKQLELKSNGFEIDTEIITQALVKHFVVKEIPIKVQPQRFYRSTQKISTFRSTSETLKRFFADALRGAQK